MKGCSFGATDCPKATDVKVPSRPLEPAPGGGNPIGRRLCFTGVAEQAEIIHLGRGNESERSREILTKDRVASIQDEGWLLEITAGGV